MDGENQPRFLMCPPDHYGVEYVINPWMEVGRERVHLQNAIGQWEALHAAMAEVLDARVEIVEPAPGWPDMVFTANAGLVIGDVFVPSRFRHSQRAGEEAFFTGWARQRGFDIRSLPNVWSFEGAGDALFDRLRPILWLGHGFRTDPRCGAALRELVGPLGYAVETLGLVDPRYYHLDTCFCPMTGGFTLYYPPAFSLESRERIEAAIPAGHLIAVSDEDAVAFACNAVNAGDGVVMSKVSPGLRDTLRERGFRVVCTPLSEFLCAGGAAKCLTLRLDDPQPGAGSRSPRRSRLSRHPVPARLP